MQTYKECTTPKGEYIDLSYLFSFSWARIYVVIGARGYGKTFSCKKTLARDKVYDNADMIILRDTVDAVDKICQHKGQKFWGDVFSIDKRLKNHDYKIEEKSIYIDNKFAGEIMALSDFYKYKGNFYNVRNILFDEFIEEDMQVYRGNRAKQFVNVIETIVRRNEKTRVIMTANALDIGNSILEMFDINIKPNKYGYYINKEKLVVVYYAPNSPEFEKAKLDSLSGRLVKGTRFEGNLIRNEFENANCILFDKRKPCNIQGIYYNNENECFRLYKETQGETYYVCKDINPNSYNYMRYVFNVKQIDNNHIFAGSNVKNFLALLLQNKRVKFESKYLFSVYCSIVNNTKK